MVLLSKKYEKTVGESLPFSFSKKSCREGGFYMLFFGFIMRVIIGKGAFCGRLETHKS